MIEAISLSGTDPSAFAAGLDLMRRIGQAINAALDPRQLIWEIYRQTHKIIPADVFTLALLTAGDPETVDLFAVEHDQVSKHHKSIGPLTRWVVKNREAFFTPDDRVTPPPVVPTKVETGIPDEPHAYILVPMIARDRVVGVISVQSYTTGAFTDSHLAILSAIASHSAVVLENVRLFATERRRAEELRSLERIGYELAGITELDEVLKEILQEVKTLLKVDMASIFVYDERKGQFQQPSFTISPGEAEPTRRIRPPRSRGLTIHIVRHGCAIVTRVSSSGEFHFEEIPLGQSIDLDAQHSFAFDDAETAAFLRERGIRSSIGFPLRAGKDMVGVLYVNYLQPHEFSRDELRSIARLAQHAATAIQRANVYDEIHALHKVGKVLTGQTEMKAVISKLFEYGHVVLGADVIVLFHYHAVTDEFGTPPFASGEIYELEKLNDYSVVGPDDIVRQVVKSPEALFIREAQTDARSAGPDIARRATRFVGRERIASSAAVPLRAEGEVVGALFFNYRVPQRFGSHQRLLIDTFAAYAAAAIHRARVMSRRVDELHALAEVDKAITSGDPQQVLERIIQSACQIVRADYGSILRVDKNQEHLSREAVCFDDSLAVSEGRYKIGEIGVTGRVAQRKQAVRISDVHAEEWRDIYVETVPGVKSELAVPILDEQKNLVGVINLESRAANAFSEDDERLLTALAEQAYIAIRSQRRFEAQLRARQELELLREIDKTISSTLSTKEVLQFIVDKSRDLIEAPVFHVMLYDERQKDLYLAAARGTPEELDNSRQSLDKGVIGLAARTGKSRRVDDVTRPPWDAIYVKRIVSTRSELAVPLLQDGKLIGVLNLESSEVGAFSDDDRRLLEALAARAVVAIQNSQLYESEQRARQVVNILHEVDKAISFLAVSRPDDSTIDSGDELNTVLSVLLKRGLEAINAPNGNIMLYDKARGDLYMAVERGVMSEHKGARQKLGEGIVGMAAREKRTVLVANVTARPWNSIYLPFVSDTRSELAVPLLRNSRLLGVLNAESPKVGAFWPDDQQLLEALAGQAVVVYQTAERYQAMQKMRGINQLLASERDPNHVIRLILEHACAFLKAEWGNLRLYDREGNPTLDYEVVRFPLGPSPDIQVTDWRRVKLEKWVTEGIVAWVAKNRQLYRSHGNVQDDERFRGRPDQDIRSEIAVPLVVDQELVGVLNLESERENAFDEEDEALLGDLSVQAAVAVRNARNLEALQLSFEATRQAQERFRALNEVGTQIINAPLDEEKILEIVLNVGLERTGAFHAIAWLPDSEDNLLKARLVRGEQGDALHGPVARGEYINGMVWRDQRLILVDDVNHPPEKIQYRPGDTNTQSVLVVPMLVGGEYFGNLDFRHRETHGFKPEDVKLLEGLAARAASAIRRARRERKFEEIRQSEREAQTMASLGLAAMELAHRISNWFGLTEADIKAIKNEIGQRYEKANTLLDSILENVKRMLSLTKQMKDQLADEIGIEGSEVVYPAELALSETLRFRTPPSQVNVIVQPSPITQLQFRAKESIFDAFRNIYMNAIEALGEQGGVITISVREANGWVEFQISDNGPGIAGDKLKKIFDLFYSTKKDSLGFGLWSAQRRTLASGGQVSVTSEVGKGTTFIIRLPSTAREEKKQ